MTNDEKAFNEQPSIQFIRDELAKTSPSRRRRVPEKFALAALGSIPWVGGFMSAAASLKAEEATLRTDSLQTKWLEERADKLERLQATLDDIVRRFESLGERIESEEYLNLVRRAFRAWDRADTDEKRRHIANLVSNAGEPTSAQMMLSDSSSTG